MRKNEMIQDLARKYTRNKINNNKHIAARQGY